MGKEVRIPQIWDNEPDFVNEEGTEWWFDKDTTDYVKSVRERKNIDLPLVVFVVRRKDGYLTRMILNAETNEPLYENQQLESVCVRIDILAASELYK